MGVLRRVACLALPEIRGEIARAIEQTSNVSAFLPSAVSAECPLAIVVTRSEGTVKTERDVIGGTRLDFASARARRLGVHAGQTVASARALCADLRVRVVTREAIRIALARIAEALLSFGPTVAYCDVQDVVWVEVGGCAHLEGGERAFARAMSLRVRGLGHSCRIAIAEGPRIAAAVARFAPARKSSTEDDAATFVVPEGKGAAVMRVLPVAALGLDADTSAWLFNLGLRVCGDLQKLPRRSLGTRLGSRAADVIALLGGEDRAPIEAWRPPEVPEERIELDWGIASIESLAFVVKSLCDRLAARLEGRVMAAACIEIVLNLDRSLYEASYAAKHPAQGSILSPLATFEVALPAPIARAGELLAVVRARLDRETLTAPVIAVTLRASKLARVTSSPLDMFAPEPRALRALPALVSELTAELGEVSVGTLALADTWIAGERTRLVPFGAACLTPHHSLVTAGLEPSRVVLPTSVSRASLSTPKLLARIEAVQWWRRDDARCDIVAAWIPDHRALACVELVDRDQAMLRGWLD